jgi:bifunctional non-homologous end joining protein LigD
MPPPCRLDANNLGRKGQPSIFRFAFFSRYLKPMRKSPYQPCIPTRGTRVPAGKDWLHEIKHDGYRVQIHLANEAVKIFTRRGHDWTHRFKKVTHDAWHIKAASAVIDGEIVVPAADGTTDFSVLQNELKGSSKSIVLVAFDLLYLNGRDLRKLPLVQRKAKLKKIIAGTEIQFSESFEIDGGAMFEHACKLGRRRRVEGPGQRLPNGAQQRLGQEDLRTARDPDHRRLCARRKQVGSPVRWPPQGKRSDLRRQVDHGFDKVSAVHLRKRLEPLVRKTQPYAKRIAHKGIWVEPKLHAEIEYRAKSAEGKVRHPFYKGLREDLRWMPMTDSGNGPRNPLRGR